MLHSAAEAIAASLTGGSEWKNDLPMQRLRDAFLAECGDESKASAKRCKRLRKDLAKALRGSLAMGHRPTQLLLEKGTGKRSAARPGVWVEVRGTAGRNLIDGAFTIGRAPECDVQVWGDEAVMPVQVLAISLPGGIVIVDAWSGGSTKVIWRHGDRHAEPPPTSPSPVASMVVSHKERLVLCVGAHTAVTLGPAQKANKRERKRVQACNSSMHASPLISPALAPSDPPGLEDDDAGYPLAKKLREDEVEQMSRTSTSLDSESTTCSSSRSASPSGHGSRETHGSSHQDFQGDQ